MRNLIVKARVGTALTAIAASIAASPEPTTFTIEEKPGGVVAPFAFFVEMFTRAPDPRVPDNIRTGLSGATMPGGGFAAELEIAVTGAQGSTTLTSPDTAKVAGLGVHGWSGVVTAASGAQRHVLVSTDNGSTTITLRDPLPIALTAGSKIKPYFADALDQHRTQAGTTADATALLFLDKRYCCRQDVFAQVSVNGDDGLLSALGSPTPFFGALGAGNILDGNVPVRHVSLANSGYAAFTTTIGQGVQGAGDLPEHLGFIEFDVSGYGGTGAAGTVKLWITDGDAVERLALDTTFAKHVRRFTVPIEAADVSWRFECARTAGTGSWSVYVGELRIYRSAFSGPMFVPGNVVSVRMDSWGQYYSGLYVATLAALFPGTTFIDNSLSGTTANWLYDWGRHDIDLGIYTHILEGDAINSFNDQAALTYLDPDGAAQPLTMGADEAARTTNWIAKKMGFWAYAKRRGVQVISLMPPGTASQGQAQILANKAALIPTMGAA